MEQQEVLIDEIGSLLINVGVPFLDRFRSRDRVVEDWVAFNENELSITLVARLDVAMILLKRGDTVGAKKLFQDHLQIYLRKPSNANHGTYVRELAQKVGLGDLT